MRIRVNNAPDKPSLRVGMSVELNVDTGHERGLPSFITDLFSSSTSESEMTDSTAVEARPINQPAITACVILAVFMQALDTTIANVALPYIQGSVSASADQINWVLTSYIVAAAIMTPPSGFLVNKFGRRQVLMAAVAGFVIASVLCGIAQSLVQIVRSACCKAFSARRWCQCLSRSCSTSTLRRTGIGDGVIRRVRVVGPVLGPVIGGWLTDHYTWRWIFYINVPLGALAFAGISFFLRETKTSAAARLDWVGFGSLSIAIAAMQVFLDRGAQLDWFSSFEILIEAVAAVSAFYIFLVHTFTADDSFVNPKLFLDRNFTVGMLFIFIVGITYLASLALMTPYLQTLMGYPVVTAGLVMGPRGIGTMVCMFVVGKLIGRIDTKILLMIGLLLTAWALYDMTGWNPNVSQWTIAVTGFIQGAGLGFLFVPLTTVTFATLAPGQRADATGLYNLSRNVGSSVGISVVSYLLTRNGQINHAIIGSHVTAVNPGLRNSVIAHAWSPWTASGRAALDQVIQNQASIIGYIDDFKLMMVLSLGAIPLVLLLRRAVSEASSDHAMAME
jgi:DHA2 family multidrug resistance protein